MKTTKQNHYITSCRVTALIDYMQECFPTTFPKKPYPKVPLKIGIFDDLVAWGKTQNISKSMIRKALRAWCQGTRYFTTLSITNCPRFDLNGIVVDFVSPQHNQYAKTMLNKIFIAKKNKLSIKPDLKID